jgi:GNAT superfamily N-acetyltransferase
MEFTLRPLEPTDGPAIGTLMRSEAQSTALALTTTYLHDPYTSLVAQHPNMFGVVATAPRIDGLVGMGTAFTSEVRVGDATHPSASLENLKVRHDVRRQGLGRRLAEWRIADARRRLGDDVVIQTGVDATNAASLATAARWATQVLGPVRVVIARMTTSSPPRGGGRVRPLENRDVEAVVDGVNAFHASYHLYPPQNPERLMASLAPTALGTPLRCYRVVEAPSGMIVAGASVSQRFQLMTERIEHAPRPLVLLSKVLPLLPPDGVIRTIELSLTWYAPGHEAAARTLWSAVRHEWSDRATNVAVQADERTPLATVLRAGRAFAPRVRIMVPVQSRVHFDESRPVYLSR